MTGRCPTCNDATAAATEIAPSLQVIPLSRIGDGAVALFASVDGGRYERLRKTRAKSIMLRRKSGHRYRFYSVAVDNAGNKESAPRTPDAKLKT